MKVDLIIVPFDSGLRDVRMGRGPGHLLESGLVETLEKSGADVAVRLVEPNLDSFCAEPQLSFDIQRLVAEQVKAARTESRFPIILSGNCNTAVGTVAGITATSASPPVVCWLDAHGDFNTPDTTTSGFFDGMAVAMLTGRCWEGMTAKIPGFDPVPDSQIVMTGLRDLDFLEQRSLEASGVHRVPISDVSGAIEKMDSRDIYLHVDLDVFDPSEGTANGFAVDGGITRNDFAKLSHELRSRFTLGAIALTAYDPSCDPENRIAQLAIEIIQEIVAGLTVSTEAATQLRH